MGQDELETDGRGQASAQSDGIQGHVGTPHPGREEERPQRVGQSRQEAGALERGWQTRLQPLGGLFPSVDHIKHHLSPLVAHQLSQTPLQTHLEFSQQWVPSPSPFRSGHSQPCSWGQTHKVGVFTWTVCSPGRPSPLRLWRSQAATLGTTCSGGSNTSQFPRDTTPRFTMTSPDR